MSHSAPLTLLVGGTGKTGRRIASRLASRGLPLRVTSRGGPFPFDWESPSAWGAALAGVHQMYVAYAPDLAYPGAAEQLHELGAQAARAGVSRVVLLSGRGEPEAQAGEEALRASGLPLTVLRAAWFSQNFSEGALLPAVLAGTIALPGAAKEPFLDAEDIADVAATCLTGEGHEGATYELTGPQLLGFDEAAQAIAEATGRPVTFTPVTRAAFEHALGESQPPAIATFLGGLFEGLLDGHNATLTEDVPRLLGRPARDFRAFVADAARAGAWAR